MSNEQSVETETVDTTKDTTETNEQTEEGYDPSKGEKWDRVEFTKEQQQRFNRLYKQVKDGKTRQEQLLEDNKKLFEKLSKLEEQLTDKEVKTALTGLKKARNTAIQEGDADKATEIEEEIENIRNKHEEAKKELKKEKEELEQKYTKSVLSEETQARVKEWVTEKDENGELVRPFADPKHPQHGKFRRVVNAVLSDEDVSGMTEDETFEAVDTALKAVGLIKTKDKKPTIATVLPGLASSGGSKKPPVKLSETQRYIAKKMFPNAKDPEAEYIKGMSS